MHNLGLGGLEFQPSHTVNEHRPDGFKLPEIILDDDKNNTLDGQHYNDTSSVNGFIDNYAFLQINIANETSNHANGSEGNGKSNFTNGSLSDMWNSTFWQGGTFKQMHDPKHRHPRHHGLFTLFLFII